MQNAALLHFCSRLEHTPLNAVIQNEFWIIPAMQSLHILAVASVLIGSLLINLRILGIHGKSEAIAQVISRYQSLIWLALPVLIITGSIIIVGEPVRSLTNWVFQIKMIMLIAVIIITLLLKRRLSSNSSYIDADVGTRILAILSLILWIGIATAGRWIAYTE
jgi:hypothetical protein